MENINGKNCNIFKKSMVIKDGNKRLNGNKRFTFWLWNST